MVRTLFHGSPSRFDSFIIDAKLTITDETSLMEGIGIYLTEKYKLAKHIGAYTYEVEVNESDITDMTQEGVIRQVIHQTLKKVDQDLINYISLDSIVNGVKAGKISVTKLYKELELFLDSEDAFHQEFGDLITHEEDCLFAKLEKAYFDTVGNVFKYYDSGYQHDNYICFRNPECLRIVEIETEH